MWDDAGVRFAKQTLNTRRALSVFAVGAVVVALSACQASSLPSLSGFEAVRDQAARTESAASSRASQLASLATDCASCSSALRAAAASSDERLEALGGLWDPWGGDTPDGESAPAAVSEAPTEVSAYVSWLARTATRDLEIASDPHRSSSEQARTLAAAALGRYATAVTVSRAYGIALDSGADQALLINDRTNAASRQGVQTWSIDLFDSPSVTPVFAPSGKDLSSSAELSAAVATWDCTASTLPKAQTSAGTLSDAYDVSGELLVRAQTALRAGAADARTPRCELSTLDAASLASNLLAADAAMLASESASVRSAGASAALVDIEQWAPRTPLPALIGTR
ncbi:MAG: hypothetical protein ACFNXV_04180 [Pauljensenia sp.]|uniref:hypothetical protein n=1 Tax=Actinomycetaceae TaxID=2049 RepID=UPI0001F11470|nr:hypothetical protein HMPREF9006_0368 [Actinomyces sp. oral taxon 180 str. F0310]